MTFLFKKRRRRELKFVKKNLEKFEKDMFSKLNELECNLETVQSNDKEKYEKLLGKEVVQRQNFEKLTNEILHSVELLEKNQKVLTDEIEFLKDKIKE